MRMISRVSSKNEGKQVKREKYWKTKTKQKKKKKNGTKKHKKALPGSESNPVYQRVQATPWPLHHSDTDDLKN